MSLHRRWYVGPVDEIATVLVDGTELIANRGEAVEVTAEDAERLDAQPTNWSDVAPADAGKTTIEDILADVGDDPAAAAAALSVETARARPRKTLVAQLEQIIATADAAADAPDADADGGDDTEGNVA